MVFFFLFTCSYSADSDGDRMDGKGHEIFGDCCMLVLGGA